MLTVFSLSVLVFNTHQFERSKWGSARRCPRSITFNSLFVKDITNCMASNVSVKLFVDDAKISNVIRDNALSVNDLVVCHLTFILVNSGKSY